MAVSAYSVLYPVCCTCTSNIQCVLTYLLLYLRRRVYVVMGLMGLHAAARYIIELYAAVSYVMELYTAVRYVMEL